MESPTKQSRGVGSINCGSDSVQSFWESTLTPEMIRTQQSHDADDVRILTLNPSLTERPLSRCCLKRNLIHILENLSQPEFEKFKFFMSVNKELKNSDVVDIASLMIQVWPGEQCLTEAKKLLEEIKRFDLIEYLNQSI